MTVSFGVGMLHHSDLVVFPEFTLHFVRGVCVVVQTLHEVLEAQQVPSQQQLLEHSDVAFCPDAKEPDILERVPDNFKFLMVIGACIFLFQVPCSVQNTANLVLATRICTALL